MQETTENQKKQRGVVEWYSEMNAELVIKNLIFSFFYVLVIVVVANYIMLPCIKDYKITLNDVDKQKIIHQAMRNKFNTTQGDLTILMKDNKTQLNVLREGVSATELKKFLDQYFDKVHIKTQESKKDDQNQFIQTVFEVEVIAKNLQALQTFFAVMKDSPVGLEISIPFMIHKQDNGLLVSFKLANKKTSYKMLH